MSFRTQLSIFLENKPGVWADMTRELAVRKVNLLAMSVTDSRDHAVVRIVVDKSDTAVRILEERGVLVIETDVLVVSMPNRPGVLSVLSRALAAEKVNIEYAYGASPVQGGAGIFVFRVSDNARAIKAVRKAAKSVGVKIL